MAGIGGACFSASSPNLRAPRADQSSGGMISLLRPSFAPLCDGCNQVVLQKPICIDFAAACRCGAARSPHKCPSAREGVAGGRAPDGTRVRRSSV